MSKVKQKNNEGFSTKKPKIYLRYNKREPTSKLGKKIFNFTEGLVSTAIDMSLLTIYFGFEASFAGYGKTHKLGDTPLKNLEEFNHKTIKNSIHNLRRKGFVKYIEDKKEKSLLPKITKEGRDRLKQLLPKYSRRRTWDGRLYLITYDLPRKRNKDRDRLREFLKRIGCGMLQHSVWLTPYNSTQLVQEFAKERSINDLILVSSLKKEGAVGGLPIRDLLDMVYGLTELNNRYWEFLNKVKEEGLDRRNFVFFYLSILREDPQLPHDLLPEDWAGDKAHRMYEKLIK